MSPVFNDGSSSSIVGRPGVDTAAVTAAAAGAVTVTVGSITTVTARGSAECKSSPVGPGAGPEIELRLAPFAIICVKVDPGYFASSRGRNEQPAATAAASEDAWQAAAAPAIMSFNNSWAYLNASSPAPLDLLRSRWSGHSNAHVARSGTTRGARAK